MKKKSCAGAFGKLLALPLVALLIFSGYKVWKITDDYRAEAQQHEAVMDYKPASEQIVNQSVIDLQAKYPDVVGWLTVPGTKIDYPFVWHKDNDQYLRRDLDGDYAVAGTLFMDCRCAPDFDSRNTILYGHHMRNGSMFGTLKAFADKEFFDKNRSGFIYLPYETLTLEFFAYMIVKHTDSEIYSVDPGGSCSEYVRQNAKHFRDIQLTEDDRLITLSSCSYEFNNARMVLLARVK